MDNLRFSNSGGSAPANILVVGVGGAGNNAVKRMIECSVSGVDFVVVNTDSQALDNSAAPVKINIGAKSTGGLGAGGNPEVGRTAAEESRSEISRALEGAAMVFVSAGMGGGTGTGAAPIVAEEARKAGALTVAVVSTPFGFEGAPRQRNAEDGVRRLQDVVDAIVVLPNSKLQACIPAGASVADAYLFADEMLMDGVRGITDIINTPGTVNADFNDVRSVLTNAGSAVMGIGTGSGENRAVDAANAAISSPLVERGISGATRLLVNVTTGMDFGMNELHLLAETISDRCGSESADVKYGWVPDPAINNDVRVTVLAAGFGDAPAAPPARSTERYASATRWRAPDAAEPAESTDGEASAPAIEDHGLGNEAVVSAPHDPQARSAAQPAQAAPAAAGSGSRTRDQLQIPTFLRKQPPAS